MDEQLWRSDGVGRAHRGGLLPQAEGKRARLGRPGLQQGKAPHDYRESGSGLRSPKSPAISCGQDYPTIPFIPRTWGGEQAVSGQFGCNISAAGAVVAYSGPRTLRAGESLVFQFDLAATPSKVLNMTKHFEERYCKMMMLFLHLRLPLR